MHIWQSSALGPPLRRSEWSEVAGTFVSGSRCRVRDRQTCFIQRVEGGGMESETDEGERGGSPVVPPWAGRINGDAYFSTSSSTTRARTELPLTVSSARATGSLKRRGPELPGLT